MGQSIALANARQGVPVYVTDSSDEALDRAAVSLRQGAMPGWSPIHLTRSLTELARADLFLECIIEKLAAKQKALRSTEILLSADAVMASSTSSIPISQLATVLARPERFCGLHFCHPVSKRALVEVVRGDQTSDKTIAIAVEYVRAIGKTPIVVQDGPGFLLNRLLVLYLNEALELLLDGATIAELESTATAFGMPMGPITQLDEFGIDVALRVGAALLKALPDRLVSSELLVTLYQAGRLGVKSRAGFFRYDAQAGTPSPDPQIEEIIRQQRRAILSFTPEAIMMRLLLPMLIEAVRMLEERRIARLSDVDSALVSGIAFPHNGLLHWAASMPPRRLLEAIQAHQSLGRRFEPTALLCRLVETQRLT
jgi:3-hydroxyacyl-CoA dehydrogenase